MEWYAELKNSTNLVVTGVLDGPQIVEAIAPPKNGPPPLRELLKKLGQSFQQTDENRLFCLQSGNFGEFF